MKTMITDFVMLISLISTLLLCGCANNNPYTGEKETSKTAKGATVGAIVGAAVGAATGSKNEREKGILSGAAAGALIGGGVGAYMDKQEQALRKELEATGVGVKRNGDQIELIMPGSIVFETGQSVIKDRFRPVLDSVASILTEYDKTGILVEGHTDSTGSSALNQFLSENRANSVKNYLLSQQVANERISTVGHSFNQPVASNETEEGRQANRRVELKLIPPDPA